MNKQIVANRPKKSSHKERDRYMVYEKKKAEYHCLQSLGLTCETYDQYIQRIIKETGV